MYVWVGGVTEKKETEKRGSNSHDRGDRRGGGGGVIDHERTHHHFRNVPSVAAPNRVSPHHINALGFSVLFFMFLKHLTYSHGNWRYVSGCGCAGGQSLTTPIWVCAAHPLATIFAVAQRQTGTPENRKSQATIFHCKCTTTAYNVCTSYNVRTCYSSEAPKAHVCARHDTTRDARVSNAVGEKLHPVFPQSRVVRRCFLDSSPACAPWPLASSWCSRRRRRQRRPSIPRTCPSATPPVVQRLSG